MYYNKVSESQKHKILGRLLLIKRGRWLKKMNYTDLIVKIINDMIDEQGGETQIKRNELACKIGCVPSQINYVISSRFTKEQGYIVESRRGDGGFVKIVKLNVSNKSLILHIINSIGTSIDEYSVRAIVSNLVNDEVITLLEGKVILSATAQNNFTNIMDIYKDIIRCNIFKSILLNYVK